MSAVVCRQLLQSFSKIKSLPQVAFLPKHVIRQLEDRFAVTLDVEVIVDVSFSQRELTGAREHRTQRSWMLEHQREARLLYRSPSGAVPQPNLKISVRVVFQERLQELGARH